MKTNYLVLTKCDDCGTSYPTDSEKWAFIDEVAICKECQEDIAEEVESYNFERAGV